MPKRMPACADFNLDTDTLLAPDETFMVMHSQWILRDPRLAASIVTHAYH